MYVAQQLGEDDALIHRRVEYIVETRIANLEVTMMLLCSGNHLTAALFVVGHHLFAEDMDSSLQETYRNLGVSPERRRNDHHLELFLLLHLPPFGVLPRLSPSAFC